MQKSHKIWWRHALSGALYTVLCQGAFWLVEPLRRALGFSGGQMTALLLTIGIPMLVIGIKSMWQRVEAPRKAMEQRFAAEDAQMFGQSPTL